MKADDLREGSTVRPSEPEATSIVLCSECFDAEDEAGRWTRFDAIIPQATCGICGRLCLGYRATDEA
jgi:hypothetical protein